MKISKQRKVYNKEDFYNKIISYNSKEEFYRLQDYLYSLGLEWNLIPKQDYMENRYLIIYNKGANYNLYFIKIDFIKGYNVIDYKDLNL